MRSVSERPGSQAAGETAASGTRLEELPRLVEAVRRYCRSRTTSEMDAEDAAQAAFVRFFERPREVENPEAWLIQAASFECRDAHRRRLREAQITADPPTDPMPATAPTGDPERVVAEKLLVEELMRHLGPRDRELLTLRYLADFSVDQLARRLRISQGNARIMALRARRRAHETLRALEGGAAAIGIVGTLVWRRIRSAASRVAANVASRLGPSLDSALPAGLLQISEPARALIPLIAVAVVSGGAWAQPSAVSHPAPHPPHGFLAGDLSLAAASQHLPASSGSAGRARLSELPPALTPLSAQPAMNQTVVQEAVNPGAGSSQMDASFSSVTPSPGYASDHTAYASGALVNRCAGACGVLFVTHDGGATWERLATGSAFPGGPVVLPSDFPNDPVVLVAGPYGLARSDDGGRTFVLAVPQPGYVPAAADPGSAPGDPRVLLGGSALSVYHPATRTLSAGPALPAGVARVDSITFVSPGRALLTGSRVDALAPGQYDGVVISCDSQCSIVSSYPGFVGWSIAAPVQLGASREVVAYRGDQIAISRDAGKTFARPTSLPRPADAVAVVLDSGGEPVLLVAATGAGQSAPVLLASAPGGTSLSPLAERGLPVNAVVSAVQGFLDGRVLVAFSTADPTGQFGLRCSHDGGASWGLAC